MSLQVKYLVIGTRSVTIKFSDSQVVTFQPGDMFWASPRNDSVVHALNFRQLKEINDTNRNRSSDLIVVDQNTLAAAIGPPGPPGAPGPVGPTGSPGPSSVTAHKLATTGADITIDTASPPTTAQVLTATSATVADWQTPIASGDGVPLTVEAKTADYVLIPGDAQKLFTNTGTVVPVNFTLPTWALGLSYTILVVESQTTTITAPGSDLIRFSTLLSSAGGNFSSSTIGSTVRLVAIAPSLWLATSITGSWTPA